MTAALLTPTSIKGAAYQSAVGDLVLCDATFASFVVTLPTQSQAGDQVGVKLSAVGGVNTVTVLNGPTTQTTLRSKDETKIYQSNGSGTWYAIASDLSLTQLDLRYAPILAAIGTATLSGGTVTVANTSITANSRIRVYIQTPGGTVGAPFVSVITAATSFVIKSTSASDTSVVRWEVVSY